MNGFECPSCKSETSRLIIFAEPKKLGCPNCGNPKRRAYNVNLGQTEQAWVDKKGIKHRLTTGKSWEIENRRISRDDGVTVVNKVTGKETQY